jgi:hypothetical protein
LLAEKPQGLPKLAAEKPPVKVFVEKPAGLPKMISERPSLKMVAERPPVRLFTERGGPADLVAPKQPGMLLTPQSRSGAPTTVQRRVPALVASLPGQPLAPLLPPEPKPLGKLRSPSDDSIWLPSTPSETAGRTPAVADLPMEAEDRLPESDYRLPPPVYPTLPGSGWEPPSLPSSAPVSDSPALLMPQRVGDSAIAEIVSPPSFLPLPPPSTSWGAEDDVVTLK